MAPTASSPSPPPVSVAQVLPSPAGSAATAEPMEAEVDACLTGDSVIDPIVPEESLPVLAEAELAATQALPSPGVSSGSLCSSNGGRSCLG